MSRFLCTDRSYELLEPYEGKLSRTVLRGERGSNVPALPDSCWDNFENYSELASVIVQALFSPHNKGLLRMTVEECVKRADNEMQREILEMIENRLKKEAAV